MNEKAMIPLPFFTRIWFAWVAFFRILFDGMFAARVQQAEKSSPLRLLETPLSEPPALPSAPDSTPALQWLAILQREGRFIDFLQQDVTGFSDADVGAAARVVHEGCRKALRAHAELTTVRAEEEGALVTVDEGFNASELKLIGNVQGSGPFKGKLVHRGWRASNFKLPAAMQSHDPSVLAPAEVEL
jgi:hypothetical protein